MVDFLLDIRSALVSGKKIRALINRDNHDVDCGELQRLHTSHPPPPARICTVTTSDKTGEFKHQTVSIRSLMNSSLRRVFGSIATAVPGSYRRRSIGHPCMTLSPSLLYLHAQFPGYLCVPPSLPPLRVQRAEEDLTAETKTSGLLLSMFLQRVYMCLYLISSPYGSGLKDNRNSPYATGARGGKAWRSI